MELKSHRQNFSHIAFLFVRFSFLTATRVSSPLWHHHPLSQAKLIPPITLLPEHHQLHVVKGRESRIGHIIEVNYRHARSRNWLSEDLGGSFFALPYSLRYGDSCFYQLVSIYGSNMKDMKINYRITKWAKDLNRTFPKEGTQIASKHVKDTHHH